MSRKWESNREPSWNELFDESAVRILMRRDRVDSDALRQTMEKARQAVLARRAMNVSAGAEVAAQPLR